MDNSEFLVSKRSQYVSNVSESITYKNRALITAEEARRDAKYLLSHMQYISDYDKLHLLGAIGNVDEFTNFLNTYDKNKICDLVNLTLDRHNSITILHTIFQYNTDVNIILKLMLSLMQNGFRIQMDMSGNFPWEQTNANYYQSNKPRNPNEFIKTYKDFCAVYSVGI